MRASWRKYLDRRVPRYTSYPPAVKFHDGISARDYAHALEAVELYEPLSVYVHVPFCRQLCWYCGCNMRVENRYERAAPYVDALIAETAMIGAVLGGHGRPAHLHFGGGTPNFLTTDDISRILDAIEREFGLTDDARLAIEIDPRLADARQITELATLGFSRMSLGVQDFDPDVQRAIHREQSVKMIADCVDAMRARGVGDISFDLLFGLPRQTEASFARTVAQTISLAPDRISLFGYAHMPSLFKHQALIADGELPSPDERLALENLAREMLLAAGYVAVGFDHYARPDNALARVRDAGDLRRNFQGFTDDKASHLIGLGASAISFVGGGYYQNAKNPVDYQTALAAGRLATARGLERTLADRVYGDVIEDIMCGGEADLETIAAELGAAEADAAVARLAELELDGVISRLGYKIRLAPDAQALCRIVAATLDPQASAAPSMARAI